VDPKTAVVISNGLTLSLSRRELSILIALMERPGTIRSRGELEDRLYGWQEEIESNAVEVHVHNLRNKLGRDVIETVRGLGYRLRDRP
jgi:DNA-binding response OmpR family regulator